MAYKTIDGITSSIIPFYRESGVIFVLLGQRNQTSKAFANAWALVGGFLNPGSESLEQCAARELREETGLDVSAATMKLVIVQSDPRRDPRGQIVDAVWSTDSTRSYLPLRRTIFRRSPDTRSARLSSWIWHSTITNRF